MPATIRKMELPSPRKRGLVTSERCAQSFPGPAFSPPSRHPCVRQHPSCALTPCWHHIAATSEFGAALPAPLLYLAPDTVHPRPQLEYFSIQGKEQEGPHSTTRERTVRRVQGEDKGNQKSEKNEDCSPPTRCCWHAGSRVPPQAGQGGANLGCSKGDLDQKINFPEPRRREAPEEPLWGACC